MRQKTITAYTKPEQIVGLTVRIKVGVAPQRHENGDLVAGSWWTHRYQIGVVESLYSVGRAVVRFADGTWAYSDRVLQVVAA